MSDLHKCGVCDLLIGLVRRVMCSRNRRGSNETCYRELGDHSTVRLDNAGRSSDSSSNTPIDIKKEPELLKTYQEELQDVLVDSLMPSYKQSKIPHDFGTLSRRRCQYIASTTDIVTTVVDDFYPYTAELLLSRSATWEFDTYHLDRLTGGHCIPFLGMHLFAAYDLINHFNLSPENCWKLFVAIEENYHETNPYHNSIHAADVTQAMHCFLQQPPLLRGLHKLEILVVILAAITHDLDHPGLNQQYLLATQHPLAMIYNGAADTGYITPLPPKKMNKLRKFFTSRENREANATSLNRSGTSSSESTSIFKKNKKQEPVSSLLEHHHWRMGYSCILESKLFAHTPELLPEIRKLLKALILATDITRQGEYLNKFKTHVERKNIDLRKPEHRLMVLQIALKTADISNPGRPWKISRKWSHKVCEEFFRQGDMERLLKLPLSNLCDRINHTIPNIQNGFFNFIVMPLYTQWHHYLRSDLTMGMMTNLVHNAAEWRREAQRSVTITPADQVQYSLTSTNNSSEMLMQGERSSSTGAPLNGPRRRSYSPVRSEAVRSALRRYSAPLQALVKRPLFISEVLLQQDLHPGWRPPPPADYNPSAGRARHSAEEVGEHKDTTLIDHPKLRLALRGRTPSPLPTPILTPLLTPLSSPRRAVSIVQIRLGAFLLKEESSCSSISRTSSTLVTPSMLHVTLSGTTTSPTSENRFFPPILDEAEGAQSGAVESCEAICVHGEVREECRDVLSRLSLAQLCRRRGSAPVLAAHAPRAAPLALSPQRKLSASCQQSIAAAVPTVRRGSLPVEVMAGISAL